MAESSSQSRPPTQFHAMPFHVVAQGSGGAVPGEPRAGREPARVRALQLAESVCWGVPRDLLERIVDRLLLGDIPRNYAESLIADEINRERLTNAFA